MNIYEENDYENRQHYLQCLAEEYDVDIEIVEMLSNLLGESEDFDGLVSALEDCDNYE